MRDFRDTIQLNNSSGDITLNFTKIQSRTVVSSVWINNVKHQDSPFKGSFSVSFSKNETAIVEIRSNVIYLVDAEKSGLSISFSENVLGYPKPVQTNNDTGRAGDLATYDITLYFE